MSKYRGCEVEFIKETGCACLKYVEGGTDFNCYNNCIMIFKVKRGTWKKRIINFLIKVSLFIERKELRE